MKFVIALVSYLESLGYDTSSLRKSADGSKAIVHMQYAEILSKNLDTNANVTIYDRVNPDFQALLASDEWNGNVTGTPNSFGDLAELAKYEARLTAQVTEAKTDMDNFQIEIAGEVTTAKEDLNAIVDDYQVTVNQQLEQAATKAELSAIATPKAVTLAAQMTDIAKIYVYTGVEGGYTAGNWYYHNGTAWVSGGIYQSTGVSDRTITYEKTDFEKEIALRIKNMVINGNFAVDTNGDGLADGWKGNGANFTIPRIENNTQYWTSATKSFSGSMQTTLSINLLAGHQYYITLEKTNVSNVYFPNASSRLDVSSQNGKVSKIFVPTADVAGNLIVYGDPVNGESSIKNVMIVDLADGFGGLEVPDIAYFEYMLSILGVPWFDKTLNLTDVSKNGIITAKELVVYDPSGTFPTENVNDALFYLKNTMPEIPSTENFLEIKGGGNLYNPKNNMFGRVDSVVLGSVVTFADTDVVTPWVRQRIQISNTNDVSIRGIATYVITDAANVALSTKRYPIKGDVTTIPASSIPNDAYLWVSTKVESEKTLAQIGLGSSLPTYEPYVEIEGIYANNKKLLDYPLDVANQSEHQAALLTLESERLKEEVQVLKSNAQTLFNVKMNKTTDRQEIVLKNTERKKLILHLHKRENEGYDTTNDVYLPNAENNFSDIKITNSDGAILPYRVIHYTNEFDIVVDSRLGTNQQVSLILNDSAGKMITTHQYISESVDDGKTWTIIPAFSSLSGARVNLISADDTLFFNHNGYLYRSETPYTSYTQVFDLDPSKTLTTVHITSKSMVQHPDGEIFFGVYQTERRIQIYKSVDNGLNWSLSADWGAVYQHVHGMYVDKYSNPIAIYAGLDGGGGVLKTTDKGVTWVDLREQNPDMPQSTDYGVRYADPSGYRFLGGETPIMGGHSIIKTTDDITFRPVLSNGVSVNYVVKMDNKLFATASGDNGIRVGGVYMSEDEGETWKSVYNTSWLAGTGANDGYRHMLDLGTQIIVGPQSSSRRPLRIFTGGNYAEIIVDVPAGSSSVIVESGYIYTNIQPISNDTSDTMSDYLMSFNFNEGGRVVKESVSGKYYGGEFEWMKVGKHLPCFYPYISSPDENRSIFVKSLNGYEVDSSGFDVISGITISLWGNLGYGANIELFRTDLGDTLDIITGDRINFNKDYITSIQHPVLPNAFNKIDLTIAADGSSKTYSNGQLIHTSLNDLTSVLNAINNSTKMTMLTSWGYGETDCIQYFSVRDGVVDEEQLHDEYHSYVNDNAL